MWDLVLDLMMCQREFHKNIKYTASFLALEGITPCAGIFAFCAYGPWRFLGESSLQMIIFYILDVTFKPRISTNSSVNRPYFIAPKLRKLHPIFHICLFPERVGAILMKIIVSLKCHERTKEGTITLSCIPRVFAMQEISGINSPQQCNPEYDNVSHRSSKYSCQIIRRI